MDAKAGTAELAADVGWHRSVGSYLMSLMIFAARRRNAASTAARYQVQVTLMMRRLPEMFLPGRATCFSAISTSIPPV